MLFAHDTDVALESAVNLINTAPHMLDQDGEPSGRDALSTLSDLDEFVAAERITGSRNCGSEELASVREMRTHLRAIWLSEEADCVESINQLLVDAGALPQLVKHDELDWHLHATVSTAPLAQRMGVEAAMALIDVVRSQEMARLKVCEAEDCQAVLIDLSKNRSKRYCDTGNCANRAHVAAYRRRKAERA